MRRATLLACAFVVLTIVAPSAFGQGNAAPNAKPLAFDVVSIRLSQPNEMHGMMGIQPYGFRARAWHLENVILLAYFSGTPYSSVPYDNHDHLKGAPQWVKDRYDIEAKVSPPDAKEWQKLATTAQGKYGQAKIQAALQAMLAERCKLVVHRVPVATDGYALVVSKHELRIQETKPGDPSPQTGMELPDGGMAIANAKPGRPDWTFYGASMEALRDFLSSYIRKPLVNQTGLNGRYHFVLKSQDMGPAGEDARDPDGTNLWELGKLGLVLKPTKVQIENVVIDHVEPPSEN